MHTSENWWEETQEYGRLDEKDILGVDEKRIPWLKMWVGRVGKVEGSLPGVCARGRRERTPEETRAGLGFGMNYYTYFLLGQLGGAGGEKTTFET